MGTSRPSLSLFFFFSVVSLSMSAMGAAKVVLTGSNISLSFDDVEAIFTPSIDGFREYGALFLAEPLDACTELKNKPKQLPTARSPLVLMIKGECGFEDKVRMAQNAGYKGAIVYDSEEGDFLVTMAGNPAGITIPAVFVSKASGEILKKCTGWINVKILLSTSESSGWFRVSIVFAAIIVAVLVKCSLVWLLTRFQICQDSSHLSRVLEAMPSLIYTSSVSEEDYSTSKVCVICLEDYCVGEKLRILPCSHKFHASCVDSWLTLWRRTFCPVCKRDSRISFTHPLPSESTSLLPV